MPGVRVTPGAPPSAHSRAPFSFIEETVTIARITDLTTRNEARHQNNVTRTSRRSKDYRLPVLTFEEAARVLGIEAGRLMLWTMEKLRPSQSQWSLWTRGKRELPEALIRLYLTDREFEARAPEPARPLAEERRTIPEPSPPKPSRSGERAYRFAGGR